MQWADDASWEALEYLIPHLERFDIRDQLVNSRPLPGLASCSLAALYAAGYATMLLALAWLGFRRKNLSK